MSSRIAFPRRAFLKGLGASLISLPLLPSLTRASESGYPTRMITFYSCCGFIMDDWTPTVSADGSYQFGRTLAPLNRHKNDLIVMEGPNHWRGGHKNGIGGLLTGRKLDNDFGTGKSMDIWMCRGHLTSR